MAERSLQHRPFELSHTRARQASTSSSEASSATDGKSTSSVPRRRRASPALGVHQPSVAATGEPSRRRGTKQASTAPRDRSSKGPSTSMTAPVDAAGEVSYTPTTHRISKAKKGKKVHVCEYPGCGKVFTRAEHRKRHEANHNPDYAFQCHLPSCRKGFQRADLLARHMERQHEVPAGTTRAPGSHRSTSETSSNPPSGSIMPPTVGQPQPVAAQAMPHGPGAMAITSIIEHPIHDLSHPAHNMGELGIGTTPVAYGPEWPYVPLHAEDSPLYSSDTCSSPMSEYRNAQLSYQPFHEGIQRPPSTFSDSSFQQGTITSPLSAGPSFPPSWGSSLQLPVTGVGTEQWLPLRDQSTMAVGQTDLLKVHDPRTRHYLDCYWQYFHPPCPIVRRASFVSTIPQPLLAASMVVVGAQFSPRPDAKPYSTSLYERCLKLLLDGGPITSQSPVSDLQSIIHLETFALYRGRSAKLEHLQGSPQFKVLYESLVADQSALRTSAATLQQALSLTDVPARLHAARERWIDLETRRRILAAAFVLDTQHSHLFQRPSFFTGTLGENHLDLPFPSSAETWSCVHLLTWRDLVTSQQALSLSSLGNTIPPLDPFQSSVLTYYRIHCLQYSGNPGQHDIDLHPTKSNVLAMTLTHYALSVITYTPLHALIITASESWLFGTKITDEAVWQQAKTTLRQWVTSDAALKAVWYAIRLLKLALQKPNQPQQHMEGMGSMHDLWCLYAAALVCWAVGYSTDPGMEIQQEWRPEDAEMLAANYLSAMNMSTWQDLWEASEVTKRSTRGLLECVRVRIGEVGMGGLLDGAEDVLFRLVEGESQMVKF